MTLSHPSPYPSRSPSATVILLHGLWMNGLCLYFLAKRLRAQGYRTVCFGYHSLRDSPSTIIQQLYRCTASLETETLHFVGHSLGGLLIQRLLEAYSEPRPGRVVALGTPFVGSMVAQRLYTRLRGKRLLGRCAEEGLLLKGAPPWQYTQALGVIAGSRPVGIGRLITPIPFPNDGTVSVMETKLVGMTDHCLVDSSHTGLTFSTAVIRQVDAFLKYGFFIRK